MKQKAKRCPEIKSQVARVPQKDGKGMPQNEKRNGITAKRDFPVQSDLQAGKVSASSLFSSDRFKQFRIDFLGRSCSIISCFRSCQKAVEAQLVFSNCACKNVNFSISKEPKFCHFRLNSLLVEFLQLIGQLQLQIFVQPSAEVSTWVPHMGKDNKT